MSITHFDMGSNFATTFLRDSKELTTVIHGD